MKVYKIDEQGNYIGEHECQKCPETGGFLYPTFYTETPPPELKESEIAKFDGKWIITETEKGKMIYNKEDASPLKNPFVEVPEGFTLLAPIEGKPCKWDVDKWIVDIEKEKEIRKFEIKSELYNIDMKSIRPARAGETERLVELEAEAEKLRIELNGLN